LFYCSKAKFYAFRTYELLKGRHADGSEIQNLLDSFADGSGYGDPEARHKVKKNIAAIILAAGKSTRMKSACPKVLHELCGRPMIGYVLDLVRALKIKNTVAVLGYKQELVRKFLPAYRQAGHAYRQAGHAGRQAGFKIAVQKKLIGTADAVKTGLSALKGFQGTVLVLYGDNPLLKKESIRKLLDYHLKNDIDATLLTAQLDKPEGYGRVLRDKFSSVSAIIEEKDSDEVKKDIKEINTGIVVFKKNRLEECLKLIRPNNRKKEYYLTDIISIFYKKGYLVDAVKISDIEEGLGINSRSQLAKANSIMQRRINDNFMKNGVSIVDPGSTFISFGVKIGPECVIYPFTVIESGVKIEKHCSVGPFAHLRSGAWLKSGVLAGNFIEIVRSKIGAKSLMKHFSYIGDSSVGDEVNIGAGTVTANFDGVKKNNTIIKNKSFIGSNSVIVAPVKIGRAVKAGAGSVIIRNIPDNVTVVGSPARIIKKKG